MGNGLSNFVSAGIHLHWKVGHLLPDDFPTGVDMWFEPDAEFGHLLVIKNAASYVSYAGFDSVDYFSQTLCTFGAGTHESTTWFGENDTLRVNEMQNDPKSTWVLFYIPHNGEDGEPLSGFSPSLTGTQLMREFKSNPKRNNINREYKKSVLANKAAIVAITNTPTKTALAGYSNESAAARSLKVNQPSVSRALKATYLKGEKKGQQKAEEDIGKITKKCLQRVRRAMPGENVKVGRTERGRTDPVYKILFDENGKKYKDSDESSDDEDSKLAAKRRCRRRKSSEDEEKDSKPAAKRARR